MEGDLLDVSRKMVRMNRMNADWLKFSIPFLAVWFTWLIFEIVGSAQYGVEILIGGVVGLCIGLTLGIAQYRKTRRMANEIIEQIKDME
jgi:type VI protein secretion system component VasK